MPSKKKKYNARFPAGRIKKIMQTDEEVGKVAQAVPVIISRTLELFVESLLKKSMQITLTRNAKTLTPSHMKQCILSESRFDFLKDLVKDIPDASVQEDNENNAMFDESMSQNDGDSDAAPPPLSSHSKRKYSSTEAGSRERQVQRTDLTGVTQPKRRKLPATEVSGTSTTSSNSTYPVPASPNLFPPAAAANYYKDQQQFQGMSSNSSRTPVIQYSPKLTNKNPGDFPTPEITFSVNNLLNQGSVICDEPTLRITVAPEHLSPPPLAIATPAGSHSNLMSPRLAPSENVPPLVPFRMQSPSAAAPCVDIAISKYVPGDLSIDEDYDN